MIGRALQKDHNQIYNNRYWLTNSDKMAFPGVLFARKPGSC